MAQALPLPLIFHGETFGIYRGNGLKSRFLPPCCHISIYGEVGLESGGPFSKCDLRGGQ